jgi:hypothetical protein
VFAGIVHLCFGTNVDRIEVPARLEVSAVRQTCERQIEGRSARSDRRWKRRIGPKVQAPRGGVGTRILIFFALDPKLVPKPEV